MPNWSDILKEIQVHQASHATAASQAFDSVRRKYLQKLHEHTGRNVIAYYSGFLSKPIAQSDINDEDKNGFMGAVHRLKRDAGLDLILHTPGGNIASTQSIVHYLREMFGHNIRAIVPQIAMSAGTMIACSCRSIVMGKHSNVGPIDPHLRNIPAEGVIAEFNRACKEVKNDPSMAPMWGAIISQYRPTFLGQCEEAIRWSNKFVEDQLTAVMFAKHQNRKTLAKNVVKKLANTKTNHTHERHIHADECKEMGLVVEMLEDDNTLQDLVLTVHHCYMHTLTNSPAFKIIENHNGTAMIRNVTATSR
jgi:ClpP class serine protease